MAAGVVALAGITILGRSPIARFVRPVAAPVAQLSSESFSQDAQNALQSQTATVLAGSGSIGDAAKGTKKTDLQRQTATVPAGSGSTAGAAKGTEKTDLRRQTATAPAGSGSTAGAAKGSEKTDVQPLGMLKNTSSKGLSSLLRRLRGSH